MKIIFKLLPPALIAIAQISGAALAQTRGATVAPDPGIAESPSMSTKASDISKPLVRGAEIFEILTEAAPEWKATAFKKSLSEIEVLYPEISLLLRADEKQRLDSLVTGIRTAWCKADRGALAIRSIEVYRLLQESVDHRGQSVPSRFRCSIMPVSNSMDLILVDGLEAFFNSRPAGRQSSSAQVPATMR